MQVYSEHRSHLAIHSFDAAVEYGFYAVPPPGDEEALVRARRAQGELLLLARGFRAAMREFPHDPTLTPEGQRQKRRSLGLDTLAEVEKVRAEVLPVLKDVIRAASNRIGVDIGVFGGLLKGPSDAGDLLREIRASRICD